MNLALFLIMMTPVVVALVAMVAEIRRTSREIRESNRLADRYRREYLRMWEEGL